MGSNGPNIRLASPAAANAPPSSSFVRMEEKGVLAQAPADSTIGSRLCGSEAGQSALRNFGREDGIMQGKQRRQPWTLTWLVLALAVPAWAQVVRVGEERPPQPE